MQYYCTPSIAIAAHQKHKISRDWMQS